MTLPELKALLDSTGIPVTYYQWGEGKAPDLPYIVYYADEDVGFCADDRVYSEEIGVTIEVYSNQKDLNLEAQMKDILNNNNLPYESYESYLDDEKMFLKAFEINI